MQIGVGRVGCGPLDDDWGAGFVAARVDVDCWMSKSHLGAVPTVLKIGALIIFTWGPMKRE